jgi:sugar-phosphatase
MAASRLGIAPARCVVVEDTTAGIEAGKSAGMKVIALTGTCERAALSAADLIASRLADVHIRQTSSGDLSMVVDEMPAEGKHFR